MTKTKLSVPDILTPSSRELSIRDRNTGATISFYKSADYPSSKVMSILALVRLASNGLTLFKKSASS